MIEALALLFYLAIAVITIVLLAMLKELFSSNDCKAWEQRVGELKDMLEKQRRHYELLLKDAAVKNSMMRGLWNAFRQGKLRDCYSDGGEIRVLADGYVICEKQEKPARVEEAPSAFVIATPQDLEEYGVEGEEQ